MNKNVSFILFDEWSTSFSMSSAPFRLDYKFFFLFVFAWCDVMLWGPHTERSANICLASYSSHKFVNPPSPSLFLSLYILFTVLLACCMQETDATRRVNRGRRTLTRRYFSKSIYHSIGRTMSNLPLLPF